MPTFNKSSFYHLLNCHPWQIGSTVCLLASLPQADYTDFGLVMPLQYWPRVAKSRAPTVCLLAFLPRADNWLWPRDARADSEPDQTLFYSSAFAAPVPSAFYFLASHSDLLHLPVSSLPLQPHSPRAPSYWVAFYLLAGKITSSLRSTYSMVDPFARLFDHSLQLTPLLDRSRPCMPPPCLSTVTLTPPNPSK